jgi:hypothetical protein
MSRLFLQPLISQYQDKRIRRIGYFGILPVEIIVKIFEYLIDHNIF